MKREVLRGLVGELRLIRGKFSRKRSNAGLGGISFELTFEEYCGLVKEAGILAGDINRGGYHLARYGDKGPYAVGNCRFVPYLVNQREKVVDPLRVSEGLRKYYANHPGSFLGKSHKNSTKRLIGAANAISQLGERNSQFGSCWVFRKNVERKIPLVDLGSYTDKGWVRGRIPANRPPSKKRPNGP